jgi:hypothetical protein
LLREKSVANLFGPLWISLHHSQRVREGHERLHAQVPALLLEHSSKRVTSQRAVGGVFQPLRGLGHF